MSFSANSGPPKYLKYFFFPVCMMMENINKGVLRNCEREEELYNQQKNLPLPLEP